MVDLLDHNTNIEIKRLVLLTTITRWVNDFFKFPNCLISTLSILGDPGADSGGDGKSKRVGKYGTKKSKERREEPLGTMSYPTSSKLSQLFWLRLVPENFCVFLPNQKAERRQPFGTGLVRHCPQGLFSPFFTFLRAIFSRPFRLSVAPTICPWVSEDVPHLARLSFKTYRISQITSTYLNIQQSKGSSIDSLLIISGGLKIKTQKWRSVQNHLIKIDGGHFILILGLFFFHECKTLSYGASN